MIILPTPVQEQLPFQPEIKLTMVQLVLIRIPYRCKTILEYAEEKGLSTGLVSTSAITHATPASFIAHQADRDNYEAIAADFLKTDIDVFIGGGIDHFCHPQR